MAAAATVAAAAVWRGEARRAAWPAGREKLIPGSLYLNSNFRSSSSRPRRRRRSWTSRRSRHSFRRRCRRIVTSCLVSLLSRSQRLQTLTLTPPTPHLLFHASHTLARASLIRCVQGDVAIRDEALTPAGKKKVQDAQKAASAEAASSSAKTE